jgi:hypothetical protein
MKKKEKISGMHGLDLSPFLSVTTWNTAQNV